MKGFESIDKAQRDHSPSRCNANVIKAALALAFTHVSAGDSRAVAAERVLVNGPVMTRPEAEILFRRLGLRLLDVPLAVSRYMPLAVHEEGTSGGLDGDCLSDSSGER